METPRTEYYQVHRLRLEAIAAKIEEHLAAAPDPIVATMEPGDESVFFAAGAQTPDTITAQYRENNIELPEDAAQELANAYIKESKSIAHQAIAYALATVSMDALAEYIQAHPEDPHSPWNTPDNPVAPLIPFIKASYIAAYGQLEDDTSIHLTPLLSRGLMAFKTT